MKLTKNDMARVIIQALYLIPELPKENHPKVVRLARAKKKNLQPQYELAVKILTDKFVKV